MEGSFIIIALGLGLTSSLHCIGMCGPIAFSLGLNPDDKLDFTFRNLTYQLGRILTYTLLGAIIGIIGEGVSFSGLQNPFSIAVGIMMILMAFLPKNLENSSSSFRLFNQFMYKLKASLGKFIRQNNYKSLFTTGLLNGLLPCGAVYAALTGSLAMGGILRGAVFMFFFGLGTIPLMFLSVIMGNVVGLKTRERILKLLPILMILLGVLFVLRGLDLDIPYISPTLESLQINGENHNH